MKDRMDNKLKSSIKWLVSSNIYISLIAFLTNIVLVWYLLPEDFGRFAFISANVTMLGGIINFRLGEIILRTPKDEFEEKIENFFSILILQTALQTLGAFLLLYIFDLLYLEAYILLLSIIVTQFLDFFVKIYERKFDYKIISKFEMIGYSAGHAFAVVGVLIGLGAIVLYIRETIKSIFIFIFLIKHNEINIPRMSKINIELIKKTYTDIKGIWLDNILEHSFSRLIIFILSFVGGDKITGYYFQAQRLSLLTHQVVNPLVSRLAINYFSHGIDKVNKIKTFNKIFKYQLLFFTIAVVPITFAINYLIPIIYGEKWIPIISIFNTLIGFMIFNSLFETIKSYHISEGIYKNLILFGRGSQFLFLIIGLLFSYYYNLYVGEIIGISISLGFLFAVIFLYLLINSKVKK